MRISAHVRSPSAARFPWAPVVAWSAAILILSAIVWLKPHGRTVYMYYCDAGRAWVNGSSAYLYDGQLTTQGYRYSPTASVFFTAFGALPDGVGGILWRWLGVAIIVAGFAYACRTVYPHWAKSTPTERQWLWLLILPLCVANLHNGQANLHMLGLLLVGVAAIEAGRWNLAAIALAAACFLKIYPISLVMLLIVVFPLQLGPRFLLAMVVGAALPFFAQTPTHVLDEYRTWFSIMVGDDRFTGGRTQYRDLALLLQNARVPITHGQYMILEAATGALAAALCAIARWRLRWPTERLVPFVYAVGTFWMLLCGPTTESSTYILIAPLSAWLVLDAIRGRMPVGCAVLVVAGALLVHAGLFASAFPFGRAVHDLGPQPLGTLLMAVGYLADRLRVGAPTAAHALPDVAWEQPR
jgi:hypothetical protein